jgi:hypothetical protein
MTRSSRTNKDTPSASADPEAKPTSRGPVLVDYQGDATAAEKTVTAVPHVARSTYTKTVPGVAMLLLMPGLNVLDGATWEDYEDHPGVMRGLKGDEDGDRKSLVVLAKVPPSRTAVMELISRTRSAKGLVAIQDAEKARDNPRGPILTAIDERSKLAWEDKEPMIYRAHKSDKGMATKAANG